MQERRPRPTLESENSDSSSEGWSKRGRLLVTFALAAAVAGVDQTTKALALAYLRRPVHLVGPLGLALGYNSGSAFSLFTGRAAVLAPLAAALVGVLTWVAWLSRSRLLSAAIGLVLGGAIGNIADRVARAHHGAVVDFITLTHWPTFNVADTAITVGSVLVVVHLLRPERPARKRSALGE